MNSPATPVLPSRSDTEASLQAILEAILASGETQVQEIAEAASVQAHEILANNLLEAKIIKEQAYMEASLPAIRERSRLIHRAHLEAMQTLGNARDTLVDKAFDQIRECLFHYRADPNYPAVLSRLVQETLSELEGSSVEGQTNEILLMADPRDEHVLENILTTMRLELPLQQELPIQYELNCWGGINARSCDGRIVSINTLEARLERATPALRRFLAANFEPVARAVISSTSANELPDGELTSTGERLPAT